jgi:hypothetical protein
LFATPLPPHELKEGQVFPQLSSLPHPSETVPHSAPRSTQVFGTHGMVPQRFGPAPPHTASPMHALQSIIPPQPSGSMPQLAF